MDSDSESQSSRCSSLRNQDISSIGSRASSVGSCPSQEWFQIAQFDQISLLDQFILTNMPQNPVRDSKPQICIFFNKLTEPMHKMLTQFRPCRCCDGCPVQFKVKKCTNCNKAVILQLEEDHPAPGISRPKRGIHIRVKSVMGEGDWTVHRNKRTI